MNQREGYTGLGILFAFVGGALAGAAASSLFMPMSGPETRRKLKDIAAKTKDQVGRVPGALAKGSEAVRESLITGIQAIGDDANHRVRVRE